MQLDHVYVEPSVDAKIAQEALALAIRLQQEKGNRVSIEQLQRIADEAGIDRVYLERALEQVANKAVVTRTDPKHQLHLVSMATAFSFAMITMVALNWGHDRGEWGEVSLIVLAAAVVGVGIIWRIRRNVQRPAHPAVEYSSHAT